MDPEPKAQTAPWHRALILAAAYALTGWLGLHLAVPPGFATPVWPASGIALAGVLFWGYRVWPGVWLGSFLVNLGQTLTQTGAPALHVQAFLVASAIGTGATLQAVGGVWLVRRHVHRPMQLATEGDVFKFLFLSGPVSCLINSIWGVYVLLLAGVLTMPAATVNWLNWWVGDVLGVLVFAPICLTLACWKDRLWRRRRISLVVPMVVTFTLAVTLFLFIKRQENRELASLMQQRSEQIHRALARNLAGTLESVEGVARLLVYTKELAPATFRDFVTPSLQRYPGIRRVEGIAYVAPGRRKKVEESGARLYPGFEITEADPSGRIVRAGERDHFYSVVFGEPDLDPPRLGFDVGTDPVLLEAMLRAGDSGELVLARAPGAGADMIALAPLFEGRVPASLEARRSSLRGFVSATISTASLVNTSLRSIPLEGIDLRIEDDAGPRKSVVFTAPSGNAPAPMPPWRSRLNFGGQAWLLSVVATEGFVPPGHGLQPWLVLAGGLVFASLLGGLLLVVTGRTVAVESLVEERTDALRASAAKLESEIAERRRAETQLVGLASSLEQRVKERTHALKESAQAAMNMMEDTQNAWRQANANAEALRESEERYRLIFDHALDAVITADAAGRITGWNPNAETVFGWKAEEVMGKELAETIIPQELREPHRKGLERFHKTGQGRIFDRRVEMTALHRDGTEFPVELSISPIRMGGKISFSAFVRDITERRRSEQLIHAKNQELESLLYVISHDLREPLRAVENFSDMMNQRYAGDLDARAQDLLMRISRAAGRMQQLLEDLLALSRVRRIDPATQIVDANQIVRVVLDRLGTRIRETRARITAAEELPVFRGDPTWATEAVFNLVSNALKFTQPGRNPDLEIVSACDEAGHLGIIVKDRGIGVAPEHRERIFELFQRAVGREVEGTGAGLAIVREVAARHGGRAWIHDRDGGGSEFGITFGTAVQNTAGKQ